MSVTLRSVTLSFFLLVVMNCYSQQERKTINKLVPVEGQVPEVLPTDSPNFLHMGVEKNGKYFYYFGGQQKRTQIELNGLDAIIVKHKQTEDAMFIVISCGSSGHNNMEFLITKLEDLDVKRFSISDDKPCD
jgi:hypothetical protein